MKLKTLAISISLCISGAHAVPSPFATIPLNLLSLSTITVESVPPNVMLQIDTSESMNDTLKGSGQSKMNTLRRVLTDLLTPYVPGSKNYNHKKVNWNMMGIHPEPHSPQDPHATIFFDKEGFVPASKIIEKISSLPTYVQGTPSTGAYLTGVKYLLDHQKYACTKNYMVVLSDGVPSDGMESPEMVYYLYPWVKSTLGPLSSDYRVYPIYTDEEQDVRNLPRGHVNRSGLAEFSHKLQAMDLKSSGKDAEGNDWSKFKNNIQTLTVGFGIDALGKSWYLKRNQESQASLYLRYGSAIDDPDNGGKRKEAFYLADNEASLKAAFQKIFDNITSQTIKGTANVETHSLVAPVVSTIPAGGLAAAFTVNTGNWSSELRFNKLGTSPNGALTAPDSGDQFVPVGYQGKSGDLRPAIINNGEKTYFFDQSHAKEIAKDFGFVDPKEVSAGFIDWFLRTNNKSDEQIEQAVKNASITNRTIAEYRVRAKGADADERQMGDVLNASVILMNNANYLMTGANDGMVYIFKSTGNVKKPYELALNYIPGAMEREGVGDVDALMKNLPNIAKDDYGKESNPHLYGVNGGITYATTQGDNKIHERTIALGAMGQGGRGIYALNISGCDRQLKTKTCVHQGLDAGVKNAPGKVAFWENEKGINNKLGYTISTPSLYTLAKSWSVEGKGKKPNIDTDVVLAGFVANGFKGNVKNVPYDEKPTLYVYDALGEDVGLESLKGTVRKTNDPGTLIAKIPAEQAEGAGALASPVIVDIDANGVADVAYAGDYFGDLYRFDLRGNPTEWHAIKIYDGVPSQPITAPPAVYYDGDKKVIVTFGTGSDIYDADRTNVAQQGFFGIYDDLANAPQIVNRAALQQRSFTQSGDRRTGEDSKILNVTKGWWIPLPEGVSPKGNKPDYKSSEMVVTQPSILLRTAFFTTKQYINETKQSAGNNNQPASCRVVAQTDDTAKGNSWEMAVDVKTGGAPLAGASARFSFNGKGVDDMGRNLHQLASGFVIPDVPEYVSSGSGTSTGTGTGGASAGGVGGGANSQPGEPSILNPVTKGVKLSGGKVPLLKPNPKPLQPKSCIDGDKVPQAFINSEGGSLVPSLEAPFCAEGGRLIRINTREIK